MKKPDINEFVDYRAYLKDLMDFKRQQYGFSYSKFAERAGFKSRSFLRTVITGKKNLSHSAIAKIIVGLGMEYHEGESFRALVQFNQAKNFDERRHYWEGFLKTRPKSSGSAKAQKVQDEYKYLSRFFYPMLPILLRQQHIKKDFADLARLVGASERDVKEGLETLVSLRVVQRAPAPANAMSGNNTDDYLITATPLTTSNDVPNIAIQTFHANMLDKAKAALQLHPLEREFQTQILALSADEMNYMKSRVRALMEEMSEKFDNFRPQAEKVYALNMNLIPVTPEFIRADEPSASQKAVDGDTVNESNKEKVP